MFRYIHLPDEQYFTWLITHSENVMWSHELPHIIPEHIVQSIVDHLNHGSCGSCPPTDENDPQEVPPSEITAQPPVDLRHTYLGPSVRSGHYADE